MSGAYVAVGALLALILSVAATLNLIRHTMVLTTADRLGLPRSLMRPLGILLAAGAAGLLIGIAVPWVGLAAAAGVFLYFLIAVGAHVRAHVYAPDSGFPAAVTFAVLAAAAFLLRLGAVS